MSADEPEPRAGATGAFPSPVVTAVLPEDEERGYVGKLVVHNNRVVAVGGTYGKPLMLTAGVDDAFVTHKPPPALGLRGILVEPKRITVVGEYGVVATTSTTRIATWSKLVSGTTACLYAVARDPDKQLWITGDDGLVLRSKPGGFEPVRTPLSGRVLSLYLDPGTSAPWILATDGGLAHWTGKKFVAQELPALRGQPHSLNEMIRLPSRTLVIAANGGAMLRSHNDGKTWTKSPTHVRAMIEGVAWSKWGVFAVGQDGTLLVSYDDARTFTKITIAITNYLWSVTPFGDGILIGGDNGAIYRITTPELAKLYAAAWAGKDDRIAALATGVANREEGAELVFDDALRERGWLT